MLVALSSDQQLFRDSTARLLGERAPLSRLRQRRDDPAGFEPAFWAAGAELGWTSLLVDEADGGGSLSGQGLVDLGLVAYEFGRHAAPGPLVDANVAAMALTGHGGELQQAALAGLLSGQALVACCVGAAPWTAADATLDIRREGEAVVIRGRVRPVESGLQAQHLLVTGRTGSGTTQVLVPADAAGVTVSPLRSLDVTRRFAAVAFDEVRVPLAAVVGELGGAQAQAARQAQAAAVLLAAEAAGAMQSAFDMTLQWSFERYSFGRPLASYQALKHRFADMKSWLEASHAIAASAAAAVADGASDAQDLASAAKVYTGEQGPELAQDCVQLHGGIGITQEHDLHFFLRRVTLNRTLWGTPSDHRQLLAARAIDREQAA
jgi:alkylation response protein AidB-like acyl-CoA dehydrogenase